MNKVIDSSFGEIEYKHGWIKKQKIMLWGAVRDIKIKATAYTGDVVTQPQKDSYKHFTENVTAISARSLALVIDYLKKYYEKGDYDTVKELVTPYFGSSHLKN